MELATSPVSNHADQPGSFGPVKETFDTGFHGDWKKWNSLNTFCDRLAGRIFSRIDSEIKESLNSGALKFKRNWAYSLRGREKGEWRSKSYLFSRVVSRESSEEFPLEERMLKSLLCNGKSQKYPAKGKKRRELLTTIADKTFCRLQQLLDEVERSTNKAEFKFSVRPVYPRKKTANGVIAGILSVTTLFVGGLFYLDGVDNGTCGIKEKRNGPDRLIVKWRARILETDGDG